MDESGDLKKTFLEVVGVKTEEDAIRASINAAVSTRGGGKFYATADDHKRTALKDRWRKLIRDECQRYLRGERISDAEHCKAIGRIAKTLSTEFKDCLANDMLRYGPSQKTFNLYLKNLWCLGKFATPPHCPVDGIVLGKARVGGAWTLCESEDEYMEWVLKLRGEAERQGLSLSDWENKI